MGSAMQQYHVRCSITSRFGQILTLLAAWEDDGAMETYEKGVRVRVCGYRGQKAVLRVWEQRPRGLMLCSDEGYARAIEGGEVVAIGFPFADIEGEADDGPDMHPPASPA